VTTTMVEWNHSNGLCLKRSACGRDIMRERWHPKLSCESAVSIIKVSIVCRGSTDLRELC